MKNFYFGKRPIVTPRIINKTEGEPRKTSAINIEIIVKALPLAYALAIGLGLIDLIEYYHRFDIQIWRYLEFGDILLYFVHILVPLLLFAFGLLVFTLIVTYILAWAQDLTDKKWVFYAILSVSVVATSILFMYIFGIVTLPDFFIYILLVPSAMVVLLQKLYQPALGNKVMLKWAMLSALVIAFVAYRIIDNGKKYKWISKGKTIADVQLRLKNLSTIKTSDSILYLGSTKNYHFFRKQLTLKQKENVEVLKQLLKKSSPAQINKVKAKLDSAESLLKKYDNLNIIVPESEVLESRIRWKYNESDLDSL